MSQTLEGEHLFQCIICKNTKVLTSREGIHCHGQQMRWLNEVTE